MRQPSWQVLPAMLRQRWISTIVVGFVLRDKVGTVERRYCWRQQQCDATSEDKMNANSDDHRVVFQARPFHGSSLDMQRISLVVLVVAIVELLGFGCYSEEPRIVVVVVAAAALVRVL